MTTVDVSRVALNSLASEQHNSFIQSSCTDLVLGKTRETAAPEYTTGLVLYKMYRLRF